MAINEIINSVKATLYERTVSPLGGAFVISWCLWNYKFLLVLFSSDFTVEKKILLFSCNVVGTGIYSGNWDKFFTMSLYPLASAFLFLIAYPVPAKWMYEYSRKNQKKLKDIKATVENETLLTLEESRQLRLDVHNIGSEMAAIVKAKDDEIGFLKSVITDLNKEIDESKSGASDKKDALFGKGNQDNQEHEFPKLRRNKVDAYVDRLTSEEHLFLCAVKNYLNKNPIEYFLVSEMLQIVKLPRIALMSKLTTFLEDGVLGQDSNDGTYYVTDFGFQVLDDVNCVK